MYTTSGRAQIRISHGQIPGNGGTQWLTTMTAAAPVEVTGVIRRRKLGAAALRPPCPQSCRPVNSPSSWASPRTRCWGGFTRASCTRSMCDHRTLRGPSTGFQAMPCRPSALPAPTSRCRTDPNLKASETARAGIPRRSNISDDHRRVASPPSGPNSHART